MSTLLTPIELDELLRYPNGRSARLARKGLIPHLRLPDGSIRFERETIEGFIRESKRQPEVIHNEA